MSVISWNESLVLNQTVMDQTHQEFAHLLNRLADASGDELNAVLEEFIVHTEAHFAQEEQWMAQMAFPPMHCHSAEHKGVLEIAQEVRRRVAAGEAHLAKVLAQATAEWFANHAVSMDAMLATYMKQIDFEPGRDVRPNPNVAPMDFACGGAENAAGACHAHQSEATASKQDQ
jgi:hemerythrin-like metal-binding protein